MWIEMLVGVLVISALVVLMGPSLWSSRLSMRDKQPTRAEHEKKDP